MILSRFYSVLVQAIAILFSFRSEERYYNHFRFYFVLVHDNNTVGKIAVEN